jgi:hypothetical protein
MEPSSTKPRTPTGASGEAAQAVASRNTVYTEERRDNIQGDIQSELSRLMTKTSHLSTVAKDLPRLIKGLRLMKDGDIPEIVRFIPFNIIFSIFPRTGSFPSAFRFLRQVHCD